MIPRSVWLVRHGQTDWNVTRRYMSTSDRELTAFGTQQAHALGNFFAPKKIDVIVHSGLSRTSLTAQAIAGSRAIPTHPNERWREAAHGLWEGLTYKEVMQRMPQDAAQRFNDPLHNAPQNGESLLQLQQRVWQAWQDLGARYPKQRVVVITHGGVIQALLCSLLNTPLADHWRWRIDLGSATGIDVYPTATILRTVNHVPKFSRS